jgi:hypothetical protein
MKFREKLAEHQGQKVEAKDRIRTYRGVYIGPPGIWIDRTLVATLAELDTRRAEIVRAIAANVKLLPTIGLVPSVALELRDEPASVAVSALRLFTGVDMIFDVRVEREPDGPPRPIQQICRTTLRDQPIDGTERVNLSVLLDPDKIWLGLSAINEFYMIEDTPAGRDFAKLETTLKEQKTTAFFADRTDLELAAPAGTSHDVLVAFDLACGAGFRDLAILPRDQISAIPQL